MKGAQVQEAARRWYGLSRAQVDGPLLDVLDRRWRVTPRQILDRLRRHPSLVRAALEPDA